MTAPYFPEPWVLVGNRVQTAGKDRERRTIATINAPAFDPPNRDALLILAAPDLLAACRYVGCLSPTTCCEKTPCWICHALTKVDGRKASGLGAAPPSPALSRAARRCSAGVLGA